MTGDQVLSLQLLKPDTEQWYKSCNSDFPMKELTRAKELSSTKAFFSLQLAQILKFAWPLLMNPYMTVESVV